MSKSVNRLYETFQPQHYDLALSVNKKTLTFTGNVQITGQKVGRPSKRITLHQKDLKITKASITHQQKDGQQKTITLTRLNHHKSYEEIRLHADETLPSGQYIIDLEFRGQITKAMLGIYPSYFQHHGEENIIIATQFESHYARAAFPCVDEPEAKATFKLTLTGPQDDVYLSNTPIIKSTSTEQGQTVQFEKTPKMSSYLLAFVIGPLHSVKSKTKSGTQVATWAAISRPKHELEYSVKEAVNVLDFYEDHFQTPYPLAKCDQVALPDFDSGAMENWGLVTYREIALLTDPTNRSVSNEQYVSLVIAHELAHQWFGNLVTMKWWDDLWLNESFASLMEHLCLDKLHPDWQQWEIFTASDVLAATNRDIYKNIQPVGVDVTDPDLIETLFDPGIVYAKGARLLKMLREYIGDDAFRKGLQKYFIKHAYQNTTRDDLWAALTESSNKDISALMTPWIEQSGMPIIHASQTDNSLELTQERYVLDTNNDRTLWPIPLLANNKLPIDIFDKKSISLKLTGDDYIVLNQFASGHFFTNYQIKDHQNFLAKQIGSQALPTEARMNILNDAIMLARRGDTSLTDALTISMSSDREPRDSVWTLILRSIGYARQLTEGDKATHEAIKASKIKLAKHWYSELGWSFDQADDSNTHQLRHTAIALMIAGEDQSATEEAFSRYSSDIASIDAELRATILSANVKHNRPGVIEYLLKQYPEVSADVQLDIVSALSSTESPETANLIISQALGQSGFVRPQDIMRWVAMFIRNQYTRQTMWDYILQQWKWLENTLGESKSFDYLPTYLAGAMNSKYWEKQYHQLFNKHLTNKTLERNITVGFADIAARLQWRDRDEKAIRDFYKNLS